MTPPERREGEMAEICLVCGRDHHGKYRGGIVRSLRPCLINKPSRYERKRGSTVQLSEPRAAETAAPTVSRNVAIKTDGCAARAQSFALDWSRAARSSSETYVPARLEAPQAPVARIDLEDVREKQRKKDLAAGKSSLEKTRKALALAVDRVRDSAASPFGILTGAWR